MVTKFTVLMKIYCTENVGLGKKLCHAEIFGYMHNKYLIGKILQIFFNDMFISKLGSIRQHSRFALSKKGMYFQH